MTAGERLIEEGVEQGIEQGIQQGIQQRVQRERAILLRLLKQRFGDDVDAAIEHQLATASVEQIDLWAEREVAATALADVFAD